MRPEGRLSKPFNSKKNPNLDRFPESEYFHLRVQPSMLASTDKKALDDMRPFITGRRSIMPSRVEIFVSRLLPHDCIKLAGTPVETGSV